MFYELFDCLMDMSITASIVIVAVLIVRAFMGKMPKRYSYALWLIVAFRLLCPVGFASPVSVFNLLGDHKVLTTEHYLQEMSTSNDIGQQDNNIEKPFDNFISVDKNEDYYPDQETKPRGRLLVEGKIDTEEISPFVRYGTIVWLSIAAILVIWNVISLFLMKKKVSSAIRFRDNVYECDDIPTPFVMGFVSPKIYIPFRLDEEEREYIIKHERHHIDRKDNIIKLIAVLITCIYWFHPLVWISYFLMTRDMEMSCDEYVLQKSTGDIRENYSRSLLAFATNQRNIGMGLISFGESDTRKRVKHIMKFKECGKWISMAAVGLIIAAGVVCLTDAKEIVSTKPVRNPQGITKSVRNPQEITVFSVSEDSLDNGKPFQYQDQEYQIQEHRIKGRNTWDTDEEESEEDIVLYWTLQQENSQEIPLVDPQANPPLNSLEKQEFPTRFILQDVFFLSGYLFYTYQECIVKPYGENGTENDWGTAMLCRINLETMETDQSYTILTKEEQEQNFTICGADPDSGYIYLTKGGNIHVLDLSLKAVDVISLTGEDIEDIYWAEEGYVLTTATLYQMNLALDENEAFQKPEVICAWPFDFYNDVKIIGTYGRFLYGYTYYHGNNAAGIAGHYFQVDLDGSSCKILSADQKKSFLGNTDDEDNFDTESFANKHELYSEGRDNSDDSWDPIQIRYILSEDGSVEIQAEKIDP